MMGPEAWLVIDHLLAWHLGHGRYFVGPLRDFGGFAGIENNYDEQATPYWHSEQDRHR
jgi:hypothetical protein